MISSLDKWITREPDWDDALETPHCSRCGAFLRREADRLEDWEEGFNCDGSATIYEEPYSDDVVEVVGEEFKGKTYKFSVSECGLEVGAHEPHRVTRWEGVNRFRVCRKCGTENKEVEY